MIQLENVTTLDVSKPDKSSTAPQILSQLVGLAYQARIVVLKASDWGGATIPTRLFMFAIIPGIPLPEFPESSMNLNTSSAEVVTADLPEITNDCKVNPASPHHVPVKRLRPATMVIVRHTPSTPKKSGKMAGFADVKVKRLDFGAAAEYASIPKDKKSEKSCTLQRVHLRKSHPTILTKMNPDFMHLGITIP